MRINWETEELKPRMKSGDAGIDLRANQACIIEPGETESIETGVRVEIPDGWFGLLVPRSSTQLWRLKNTAGVIDSSYRGEITAIIYNDGIEPIGINLYERFCQLVVLPHYPLDQIDFADLDQFSTSERSTNGFGHSGKY